MASPNLHLVDGEGHPLEEHIADAITRHEPRIRRQFGRFCDPAELSTAIEQKARRIADQEKQNRDRGKPSDPASLSKVIWRSLVNLGITFVRKREREQRVYAEIARDLAAIRRYGSLTEAVAARLDGEKILSLLSKRDRRMCDLESQGISDAEIAADLDTSEAAVRQARFRRKARVAAVTSRPDLKSST